MTAFVPGNCNLEASLPPQRLACAGHLPEAVSIMRHHGMDDQWKHHRIYIKAP